MKKTNHIRGFTGLILALFILLPSLVQLSHVLEEHEHKVCFNESTHFHEKIIDCSIQDFQISSFNFVPLHDLVFSTYSTFGFAVSFYDYLPYNIYDPSTNNLRAPPIFS